MSKENKSAGSPAKSLLFLVPLAVTAAAALIGIASLKPVPTELPEKLAYTEPTARPAETAKPDETHGAEATEAPSEEPIGTPESATEAPATREPEGTAETQSPENTEAPETTPAQQSAEPTAGAAATPNPTSTPAAAQAPNNTGAPQHTGSPTAAPTNAPTSTPTERPTSAPTAPPTAPPTETPGKYRDGTYTASARCTDEEIFDYTVEVTINIQSGDIKTVNAVRKNDISDPDFQSTNEWCMAVALDGEGGPGIRQQIIANNGTDSVDTVSGATFSSRAIISAAKSALAKATKGGGGVIEPVIIPEKRVFGEKKSEE